MALASSQHGATLDRFLACASGASVISFDLFDTLVIRVFARPTDLFRALSDRLATHHVPFAADFAIERERAEARARQKAHSKGDNEVTLASIYAELSEALNASLPPRDADLAAIMQLECELEIDSVRIDRRVKDAFDTLISQGRRVVLVSDMYLPLACIETMLARLDIFGHQRLYLSNHCGTSKANGSIWPYLRNDLALSQSDLIVHLGDNAEADGSTAARFGVRPFVLPDPQSRIPANLLSATEHWFHGCCLALLSESLTLYQGPLENPAYWLTIAHLIVLPAALGMAGYARDVADREGTDRIFFLARDGLIFRKAYEAAWRRSDAAESRYVWASRRCLNVAMMETIDDPEIDFLLSYSSALSIADLIRRIDIDPTVPDVQPIIERHFADPTQALSTPSDRVAMCALLRDLAPAILARAARERGPLLAHLDQLGMFDGPGVMVDLGWHGSMQRSLVELGQRQTGSNPDLAGAYLGTFEKRVRVAAGGPMRTFGWLFDGDDPTERASIIRKSVEVVELLFSAPENGIKHLQEMDGRVTPVRIVEPEEDVRLGIASAIHDAVETACIALKPFIEDVPRDVFQRMALSNLDHLLSKPTAADVSAFSMIKHADGFGISCYKPIIQPHLKNSARWELFNWYRESFWQIGFQVSLSRKGRLTVRAMSMLQQMRERRKRRKRETPEPHAAEGT